MSRFLTVALAFVSLAFASGCSTLPDAEAAKGTGASRTYDKPFEDVWMAVIETIRSADLTVVSANKEKATVLAQGAVSAFGWGENVSVFVEDVGGRASTRVEVVNKRALATNITAKDWETRILEALDKRLK